MVKSANFQTNMVQEGSIVYFKYLLICATISSLVSAITLSNQDETKSSHTRFSSEPGNVGLVTPVSKASKGKYMDRIVYRYVNSNTGTTCILLKTDAVLEVKFSLYNSEEQILDYYIPDNALVNGNCENDLSSFMSISWKGYNLVINFKKTPAGERWYIKNIELTGNTDMPEFYNITTHGKHGKLIKLYHKEMLIPTPVGKYYSCPEIDIDLEADEDDHPPPGLRGSLLLRLLQLQPFMDKGEEFESSFECQHQKAYRYKMALFAAGST